MTELKKVFSTPDGKTFGTRAEALDHIRKPKVLAALNIVTGNNGQLADWLLENEDSVKGAFETGVIKRVTKSEAKKLEKACAALAKLDKAFHTDMAFLIDNASSVQESFRWPKVARMDEEQKAVAARNTLMLLTDNDAQLVDWILAQKDTLLVAYEAGKEKRAISPKAQEGLAAYRAKKEAEKAAAKAAEAAAGEGEEAAE